MGVKHNIVDKSGSWYSYGSDRIGQGRDNVREFLINNPETAAEIEGKLRDLILGSDEAKTEPEPEESRAGGAGSTSLSDSTNDIRARALDLLAAREHSRTELARKLKLNGFDETSIEVVISDLHEQNLQSDERFCRELRAQPGREG